MSSSWRWAGASAIGTWHVQHGIECQDRAACQVVEARGQWHLSVVVCDGAGSASEAALGAALVRGGMQRAAVAHLRAGGSVSAIDAQVAAGWLDPIRARIRALAARRDREPRDFAATVVAALISPTAAVVVQVGDGAAVLRHGGDGGWIVPCRPYHGEYAGTTRFVTDEPAPVIEVGTACGRFDRVAVLTDGMEHLVLDRHTGAAHKPFFDRLTDPVADTPARGRDRRLSRHLRSYLKDRDVCAATHDDKTLVIGVQD